MKSAPVQLDRIFDAFANKHRRRIIEILSLHPASISQLAKQLKVSLSAIHRHIKVLEQASLVQRKKSGRCNFLALDRTGLLHAQDWVTRYHSYWGNQKESLENYISEIEKKSER
jgi:DNA-binding transcriptional ArsR family regulator